MAHSKVGARVDEDFSNSGLSGMQVVKLPPDVTVNDAIREYRKNPDVLYAEPNYRINLIDSVNNQNVEDLTLPTLSATTANDPFFSLQWYLTIPGS